jgi:hypothetical protein
VRVLRGLEAYAHLRHSLVIDVLAIPPSDARLVYVIFPRGVCSVRCSDLVFPNTERKEKRKRKEEGKRKEGNVEKRDKAVKLVRKK